MKHYLEKLKSKGLKLTPRRREIIKLFLDRNCHLTPENVWEVLQEKFDKCGLPSVYRNLESLVECGVLTRIQQFDSKKHYGICRSAQEHHHHIVCLKCGKVETFDDCRFRDRNEIKGYQIVSHFMQVNGICAECQ